MIEWTHKNCFRIRDTRFRAFPLGLNDRQSTVDEFVMQKSDWMLERYQALVEQLQPKHVFELGIWRGGSCVFFHELARAQKLVAVDISEQRITAVDEYIKTRNLDNSLRLFYGVNQADVGRLRQIACDEFPKGSLDLVIDDASHFLDESRASFNALFPLVRPGGVYVIEDWPWAHGNIAKPEQKNGLYPQREPLTKLIFELILACPSAYPMIEKIEIDRNSATIWRGEAELDANRFDISSCYYQRGGALIRQ
jgi:predicted O-methyltransferase YrrM